MRINSVIRNIFFKEKPDLRKSEFFDFDMPKIKKLEKDIFERQIFNEGFNNFKNAFNVQEILDNNKVLAKILNSDTENYSVEYVKYLENYIRKYPDLIPIIKRNEKLPAKYMKIHLSSNDYEIEKIGLQKIKELTGNNPKIGIIRENLLGRKYINWLKLIPENCTKEKANEIVQTIYESVNTIQRLDSINFKENGNWALKNKTIIDCTTRDIIAGEGFIKVLKDIGKGYGGISKNNKLKRGYPRISPMMSTPCDDLNYREYQKCFNKYANIKRKSPFPDIELTQIYSLDDYLVMFHPQKDNIDKVLEHAKENYTSVMKYVQKRVNGEKLNIEELKTAEDNIAQIHFLVTNALPFERGTAGIANILTRSMYKALGIDLPAVKHNVALDLEAFCQPLEEYKKNWNNFFELR